MTASFNPDALLLPYYQLTFQRILGLEPQWTQTWAFYLHWEAFLRQNLPPEQRAQIQQRLSRYRQTQAAQIKIAPLSSLLQQPTFCHPGCHVLDFGCGSGEILHFILRLRPDIQALGFDPDLPPSLPSHPQLHWSNNLQTLLAFAPWDLVLSIHVLHHLSHPEEMLDILHFLTRYLRPGGLFFLYEDSWSLSIPPRMFPQLRSFDEKFRRLSTEDKRLLFARNEYWANTWFYRRELQIQPQLYLPLETWRALLEKAGLRVLQAGALGFHPRRLHGVPAVWLIAYKAP